MSAYSLNWKSCGGGATVKVIRGGSNNYTLESEGSTTVNVVTDNNLGSVCR